MPHDWSPTVHVTDLELEIWDKGLMSTILMRYSSQIITTANLNSRQWNVNVSILNVARTLSNILINLTSSTKSIKMMMELYLDFAKK